MYFEYLMPTRIFFGEQVIRKHCSELKKLGKKALIVTGARSAKINGSLSDMETALQMENIKYEIFDRVEENPSTLTVEQGANFVRAAGCEFVIGIGGGSPMDAAKAIAALATNDMSGHDLLIKPLIHPPLPIVAVPTTAGTGSEVTQYSVLTDHILKTKKGFGSSATFPTFAFLDARYTLNLPRTITNHTAIDALSHALEGYVSNRSTSISDALALESLHVLAGGLKKLQDAERQLTLSDREELLYGSMLAGMVIAQTGTTLVHSLGYPVTYYHGIPHGAINGILLPSYMEYLTSVVPEKVNSILHAMGLIDMAALQSLIYSLLEWELHLSEEQIRQYSEGAANARNAKNTPGIPEPAVVADILRKSLEQLSQSRE